MAKKAAAETEQRFKIRLGGRDVEVVSRVAKLDELSHHPANPRLHGPKNLAAIKASLTQFGQQVPLVVNERGQVLAGNGRLESMRAIGWKEAWVAVAELSEMEQIEFMVADNRTAELATWDAPLLSALLEGIEKPMLARLGFDEGDVAAILGATQQPGESDGGPGAGNGQPTAPESPYTVKVVSPVYEPRAEAPALADLYDTSRRDALVAEIDADPELDEPTRAFLRAAAERHTVLRFDRIADFYAHARPEVQKHMEDSALVIIDFRRAIELGFVRLNEDVAAAFAEDYPDA